MATDILKVTVPIPYCAGWKAYDQPNIFGLVFMCVCNILLKMCVNYTEQGNGARHCHGIFSQHIVEKKNVLLLSVDWKHGAWVDGDPCLRFQIHVAQVGYCDQHNPHFLENIRIYHRNLNVYFFCAG